MKKTYFLLEVFLIFCVFTIFGAYAVPDVNEAHYLGKAAAFWNPDYARGDFFLESPDAHAVFYWTFGWTTQFLTMEAVAWLGRILTWLGLATGWLYLVDPLRKHFGEGLLSATLFLFLSSHFSFAGEWVVGGVEAKGFAFVFLFFAVGALVRDQWNRGWILLGLATMFHVIIGGWSIVAAGMAWMILRSCEKTEGQPCRIPTLVSMLPALGLALGLSLFALIPALRLNAGASAEAVKIANQLYVFERLPHHLLLSFIVHKTPKMLINFGALFLIWSMLATRPRFSNGDMNFRAFIYSTAFIALGGWVLNLFVSVAPDTMAALLRFYWFRLVDVGIPMGVAVLGVACCRYPLEKEIEKSEIASVSNKQERKRLRQDTRRRRFRMQRRQAFLLFLLIGLASFQCFDSARRLVKWGPPRSCSGAKYLESWKDICYFVRENTDPSDTFVVPYTTRTFTWYARRPVVGVWKDIPQDAAGLLEWWNRMQIQFYGVDQTSPLRPFGRLRTLGLLPPDRLEQVEKRYHAPYVVSVRGDWKEVPPLYENEHFGIWRIADLSRPPQP